MLKRKLPLFLLVFLVFLTFLPATGIKFSWIDDGWDILMAQKFVEFTRNLDFNGILSFWKEDVGRFRPVYWLWQIFTYLLAGQNPVLHYFLHFLLILGIVIFIYKIVVLLTKSKEAGLFSGSFFLLNPINSENWYRLGPQEPLVGFFITASVFFLLRGKNQRWPVFLLILAFLSKETALAILPPVVILYLGKRFFLKEKDKLLAKYAFWGSGFFSLMLLAFLLVRAKYSMNYSFDLLSNANRFFDYLSICIGNLLPFSVLFIFTFLLRVGYSFIKREPRFLTKTVLLELFFGFWFISFLVVQSPWFYTLRRYLLPVTIGLLIFMGIELSQVESLLQKRNKNFSRIFNIAFGLLFSFFLLINLLNVTNLGRLLAHNTTSVQKMIEYLAKNSPPQGRVYLNFLKGEGTKELVVETEIHLGLFYGRPDIKIAYLDLNNLPQPPYFIISESNIRLEYKDEEVKQKLSITPQIEIKYDNDFPVVTTPDNFIKQVIKKTARKVFKGEKFTADGIYTTYYLRDNWKIYTVN